MQITAMMKMKENVVIPKVFTNVIILIINFLHHSSLGNYPYRMLSIDLNYFANRLLLLYELKRMIIRFHF